MKGIDLARLLYETKGSEMIRRLFPDYENRMAIGLVGQGSECFGFDDEISQDHDFGERFCIWLTKEDYDFIGADLLEAYQKEFPTQSNAMALRSGVFIIDDFYRELIGIPGAPSLWQEWFYIPEYALATAVNGEVFRDERGIFSKIREKIKAGFPRDVFLKKLAAHLALMAQSGQYNYFRMVKRGERYAAYLAIHQFIDHAFHCLFLLNNAYLPFYKWRFAAAAKLVYLSDLPSLLAMLAEERDLDRCGKLIEQISSRFFEELKRRNLVDTDHPFLEAAAKETMRKIEDPEISTLHLMDYGSN